MIQKQKQKGKGPIYSELQSKWAVQQVISKVDEKIFERNSTKLYSQMIARNFAVTNQQSIEQISANIPQQSPGNFEDYRPVEMKRDADRPFSAKVHRPSYIYTQGNRYCNINLSSRTSRRHFKYSSMKNTQSFKSIRSKGSRIFDDRPGTNISQNNTLVPLSFNVEENEQEDKIIQKLRREKLKAEQYENKKNRFMKTISKQKQVYSQSQSKFLSALGSKQHTYSGAGNLIEINSTKKNPLKMKKKARNLHEMKRAQNKDQKETISKQNIVIQYKDMNKISNKKQYIFEGCSEVKTSNKNIPTSQEIQDNQFYRTQNCNSTKFTFLTIQNL